MPLLLPKAQTVQPITAAVPSHTSQYVAKNIGQRKKKSSSDLSRYAGSPIHLSATCTVNANSSAAVNAQALHNPLGGALLITHFKFAMNFIEQGIGGLSPNGLGGSGATLSVSIDLNGSTITNGFVPVWLFGKTTNLVNEQTHGFIPLTGGTTATDYGEWVWELPRPFWVGPDDQLSVNFQHNGQFSNSINARVSISGSVVGGATPKIIQIPYAAAYTSKVFLTVYGAADSDASSETDLVNTTDDVIYVSRLSGRLDVYNQAQAYHSDGPIGLDDLGAYLLTAQIWTGHGLPVVPYSTTFRNVFCGVTRSWELDDSPLKPGDYFLVNLAKAAATGNIVGGAVYYGQAMVGLVGWRSRNMEAQS